MSQETQLAITWFFIGFIGCMAFFGGLHLFDLIIWKPLIDRESNSPAKYHDQKRPHTKALGRLFRKKNF